MVEQARPGPEGLPGEHAIVVVPEIPGALLRPRTPPGRPHDDLDDVIDEVLPDTDEKPGWFDASLLIVGIGLIGWRVLFTGPSAALVLGVGAFLLGCVLPGRSAWRRLQRTRQAHRLSVVMAQGLPLRVTDPAIIRLVAAYDDCCAVTPALDRADELAAMAAAHSAVVDVASLLKGRALRSDREREYVEQRTVAIEALTLALREQAQPTPEQSSEQGSQDDDLDPATLLEARIDLDARSGFSSLTRLDDLATELRHRGDR